jgi:hypothetical protein
VRHRALLAAVLALGFAGFAGEALALNTTCVWNSLSAEKRTAMIADFRAGRGGEFMERLDETDSQRWMSTCGMVEGEAEEAGAYLAAKTVEQATTLMFVEEMGISRARLDAAWAALPAQARRKAGETAMARQSDKSVSPQPILDLAAELSAALLLPEAKTSVAVMHVYSRAAVDLLNERK